MTYEYDRFDNGQLSAYEVSLNIIQDLNLNLENYEYGEKLVLEDILYKAEAKIKQQIQSVHNNYNDEDAPALYNEKTCEEVYQDLTTSLGDLLDEATKEHDFSFFSDMTPEQLGKMGWTWEVGKGMVRKPKPCCPECHQELWWE